MWEEGVSVDTLHDRESASEEGGVDACLASFL
jgi:hypothetical protein